MADELLRPIEASDNLFLALHNRAKAVVHICLHLMVYNFAMLAMATSLPSFMMPDFFDLSVHAPHHLIYIIFPLTAGFIAYISASYIFTHVNFYAEKHLIPVPPVSSYTEDAYPLLSAIIIFVVSREVVDTLGGRHAWIWILRLGGCCILEAVFLFLLLKVCSKLFPKFGEGQGPAYSEFSDNSESFV